MNERDWLASNDIQAMLDRLTKSSDRKLRLFACACCRRQWERVADTPPAVAVAVAEEFADGRASKAELTAAADAAAATNAELYDRFRHHGDVSAYIAHIAATACTEAASTRFSAHYCATRAAIFGAQTHAYSATGSAHILGPWKAHQENEQAAQARLCREIFGNPFRQLSVDPSWRTSDVMLLAAGTYEERAFDRTPILADALQEAGCDCDDILNHLRDPNATHVRGCWALDLVLGKA